MRIEQAHADANVKLMDTALHRREAQAQRTAEETRPSEQPKAPSPAPVPKQLSVFIDGDKNVIYQFLDTRTGEVLQQVPPEEVLAVMRSIADMLRESEQKLHITI